MFEAYSIGVRISLINEVSRGLSLMSGQFARTEKDAAKLQARMVEIRRLAGLSLASAGVGAFGFMGLGLIGKALKPAEEYAHQLNIMNMAGMQQKSIAESIAASWKLAGQNMTTTATGNLKMLLDLRNVLGDTKEALGALPIVAKIKTIMSASTESKISRNADDLAFSVAKALDIIGAASNPKTFESQAMQMARVIVAFQSRVTPDMYQQTFKYARQAKFGYTDEFKYQILPTLLLENATKTGGGGGSRGTGPMLSAFYRFTNQGFINKKSLPLLESLGLVRPGSSLKTTTKGTVVNNIKGADVASSNPFLWVQNVLMPAIRKKYGNLSEQKLQDVIGQIFRGNQLAATLADEFALKQKNFLRDQSIIKRAQDPNVAYKMAMSSDPKTARDALSAQWNNFKTALMVNIVPIVVPALIKLSAALNQMGAWAREYPGLTKSIVLFSTALFGLAAIGGTIGALTFAFKALGVAIGAGGEVGGTLGLALKGAALGVTALRLSAVAFASYMAGSWIYNHFIAGTKFGDKLGQFEATVLAAFGDKTAQDAVHGNHVAYSMPPVHTSGHLPNIRVDVHLDKRKVGEALVNGKNQHSNSVLNPSIQRPFPGAMSAATVGQ